MVTLAAFHYIVVGKKFVHLLGMGIFPKILHSNIRAHKNMNISGNNVREKEGRGQGQLRRLVLYFKSKQSTSNTNLRSGTLNVPHAHNLSLRAFSRWCARTSSPPRFLSPSHSLGTLHTHHCNQTQVLSLCT